MTDPHRPPALAPRDPAAHTPRDPATPRDARGHALRHDGWTPDRRRDFLAHLADGNTVADACRMVGLSPASAYQLRRRADGATFALGWRAAVLVSRDYLGDTLLRRALHGSTETTVRDGVVTERTRVDNRLALAMLHRLDRQADAATAGEANAARLAANEFDAFLSLVAADAPPTRAARFVAARTASPADAGPVAALVRADRFRQAGAGTPAEVDIADLDPASRAGWTADQWCRAEAAGLIALAPEPAHTAPSHQDHQLDAAPDPVWYDEEEGEWRTAFPPPADFDGIEHGQPGEDGYERSLAPEEEELCDAPEQARIAAAHRQGIADRDAFFAGLRAELEDEGLIARPRCELQPDDAPPDPAAEAEPPVSPCERAASSPQALAIPSLRAAPPPDAGEAHHPSPTLDAAATPALSAADAAAPRPAPLAASGETPARIREPEPSPPPTPATAAPMIAPPPSKAVRSPDADAAGKGAPSAGQHRHPAAPASPTRSPGIAAPDGWIRFSGRAIDPGTLPPPAR